MRMKTLMMAIALTLSTALASAQDAFAPIQPDERLRGPQVPADVPEVPTDDATNLASIILTPKEIIQKNLSPLHYGACLEDLNHEIYGGLYAQMIYGESFEEGPAADIPDTWETYNGLGYCKGYREFHDGIISLLGYRFFQAVWQEAQLADGILECDVMQPARDPGLGVAVMFRIQSLEEPVNGAVMISSAH